MSMTHSPDPPKLNWHQVDWSKFQKQLLHQLTNLPPPTEILTIEEFDMRLTGLNTVINTTVAAIMPVSSPSPYAKRWWTKQLSQAQVSMRQAARSAKKASSDAQHPNHREYCIKHNMYTNLIHTTKKDHWKEWLESVDEASIWTENHIISGPSMDGGHTRIPPLITSSSNSWPQWVTDSNHKSALLFKTFFP